MLDEEDFRSDIWIFNSGKCTAEQVVKQDKNIFDKVLQCTMQSGVIRQNTLVSHFETEFGNPSLLEYSKRGSNTRILYLNLPRLPNEENSSDDVDGEEQDLSVSSFSEYLFH